MRHVQAERSARAARCRRGEAATAVSEECSWASVGNAAAMRAKSDNGDSTCTGACLNACAPRSCLPDHCAPSFMQEASVAREKSDFGKWPFAVVSGLPRTPCDTARRAHSAALSPARRVNTSRAAARAAASRAASMTGAASRAPPPHAPHRLAGDHPNEPHCAGCCAGCCAVLLCTVVLCCALRCCCAVLCCTVRCCAALCAVLCAAVLCAAVLCAAVLCCALRAVRCCVLWRCCAVLWRCWVLCAVPRASFSLIMCNFLDLRGLTAAGTCLVIWCNGAIFKGKHAICNVRRPKFLRAARALRNIGFKDEILKCYTLWDFDPSALRAV